MRELRQELAAWVKLWRAQLLMFRYARAHKRAEQLYPRMLKALSAVNWDQRALEQWKQKRQG
jgi:hypothetical protein